MMDKLEAKAKTLIDALPTWKHYAIHDTINGKEVKVLRCDKYSDYALTVEVVWKSDVKKLVDTLLSVHQQEIDKEQRKFDDLTEKIYDKAETLEKDLKKLQESMVRERGKQKLQQFDIYLAEAYGKNASALPIVLKFQELLK